jgi:hypothetical protein
LGLGTAEKTGATKKPSAAVSRDQILFEQEETEVAEKADGFWQTIVSVLSVDSCAPNLRIVRRIEPLVAQRGHRPQPNAF